MKYVKMLGLAAVAAAALMAFVGASTASATTLTNGTTAMKAGDAIHANNSGTVTLTTTFKNITCTESTVAGTISNAGGFKENEKKEKEDIAVSGSVETLTWGGCNCEVKTLAGGSLSISSNGANSGAVTSSNAEVTAQCNGTIFGNVHCIYATGAGTSLGTLNGGTGAKLEVKENNIPRLATSAICAEKAHWDATYVVDTPATLNVDQ